MTNRRSVLVSLTAGALSSLSAACRERPADADQAIRGWFRINHLIEPSKEDLVEIRSYLARPPLRPDVTLQPGLLFNPEVDLE